MAITDLTGTKWRLQDKYSEFTENTLEELFCSLKAEDIYGVLLEYDFIKFGTVPERRTSPSFFLEGWTPSDRTSKKTMNAGNTSSSGLSWVLDIDGSAAGMHVIHTPLIEITGGAGATDADVISWFEANATQVFDNKYLDDAGLTKVAQILKGYFDAKASQSYVDEKTGDLSTLTTDNKTNLVSAINEVYEKSGEPFRVKNWANSSLNVSIPYCTEEVANTSIAKMTYSIDAEEGASYQIVGMIAYEVFDSSNQRINCWPVCQFTGNGQKELSVRWACMGSSRKTATKINAWVLLKHR